MSRLLSVLRFRLRALLWPNRAARDIDDELAQHLREQEHELVQAGMSPVEAHRVARDRMGDLNDVRTRCREAAALPTSRSRKGLVDMILQDFRYGLRGLLRRPAFAILAALTLALGIAATTTIFSLVEGIVLRPLPFPHSERIVVPTATMIKDGNTPISASYPEFLEWRDKSDVFDAVAATSSATRDLTGDGDPERIRGLAASSDYFRVFGAEPLMGRVFRPGDYTEGTFRVVVLSRGFWQRRFGADPDIVGKEIRLSDRAYTVIGVVDEQAVWPREPEMWLPLFYGDPLPDWVMDWDTYFLRVVARVREGVDAPAAAAYVKGVADRLATDMPQLRGQTSGTAIPLQQWIVDDEVRTGLFVLLGAVGFVLLIACVNVANLMLAKGAEREREMAVRRALGASRADLLRQMLAESLLVACAGGLLGVGGAGLLTRAVVASLPSGVPRLGDVGLSPSVLLFATVVSMATAFVFGTLPALEMGRGGFTDALTDSGRGATGGRRVRRARSVLVVLEVVLSLVLLVGAGLMLRGLGSMMQRESGLYLDDVLVADVELPSARYTSDAEYDRFYMDMSERLASLPGVLSGAAAYTIPMSGSGLFREHLEEGAPEPPDGPEYFAQWNVVTPGFFRTVGVPVLAGRVFDETDRDDTEPTIVVSQTFAQRMFPDESPVGKRIRSWRDEDLLRTIIGVVGDVRMSGMNHGYQSLVYVSVLQSNINPNGFLVRTEDDPLELAGAVRETVWARDPALPVARLATLRQMAAASVQELASVGRLMGIFAMISLALAATGLYGVISWSVAQRGREYGIRQALGASGGNVIAGVVGGALRLVAVGLALGLVLAFALSRVVASVLFGNTGADPLTYIVVVATVVAVTVAASLVPALRATRVDPVETLRNE